MKFDIIDSSIVESRVKFATDALNCTVISLGKRSQDNVELSGNVNLLIAMLTHKHELVSSETGVEIKDGVIRWSDKLLFTNKIKDIRTDFDKLSNQLLSIVDKQLLDSSSDKDKLLEVIINQKSNAVKQCVDYNFDGIDKLSLIDQFFVSCILADKMAKAQDDKNSDFESLKKAMIKVDCVVALFAIRTYFGLNRIILVDDCDFEKYIQSIEGFTKDFEM